MNRSKFLFPITGLILCGFQFFAFSEEPAASLAISTPSISDSSLNESTSTLPSSEGPSSKETLKKESAESNQFVIKSIIFSGNSLNKSRSLEKKIKSRVKKPLDRKQLQEDVKILFETGDFDDVSVDTTETQEKNKQGKSLVVVTFTVIERPIIKRIDFKGDRQIHSTSFSDKVQSQEGNPYDKFKASLDARNILEYYRDEGYAKAQVEPYTTIDAKNKKLILTFFIIEGDRVMVKSIHVDGTHRFKEKSILGKLKSKKKKVYKEDSLREDEEKILSFYKNHGHLDVLVSSPSVTIDEEKNEADIKFDVQEGPQYQFGTVSIGSSTIFTEKELRKAILFKTGKEFEQAKLDESISNISALYADKGYLRTEVIPVPLRNPEKGTVDYRIDIVESSVVYVDGVYVDGNTYTKTHVIKREILLKSGDIFSAGKMRRSVEKIYNLGFLEDVNVDVQQPRSPDLADLIFTVKEGKPGVLSAGAGFSSVDRFVGSFQIQHQNLFGTGQKLDLSYEFGARRQNFDIGWTDPWFLGNNMSGGVDLFNTVRRRDFPGSQNSFQEKRRGVTTRLGPRLSDDLGLLFSYTIQTTEIFGVDANIKKDLFPTFGIPKSKALETDSISQVKSSFLTELALDTRDNRFDATKGGRQSVSVEVAGGPFAGDIHYYKPQIVDSWYFPTFWKFVFSVSGRASWVNSFSPSKDVPTSERFFLGGVDTVRGYNNNSIVPRHLELDEFGVNEVRQVPGRIMTIFNAEYKFPIVQEKNKTIFQGAFFLDVGGTWENANDISFTTGKLDRRMKAGYGFGFRFKTPVFPIRLDFGIPLNPRNTDTSRQGDSHGIQPYFTIGNIF